MSKRANFSLDEKVLNEFRLMCKKGAINQSAWINLKMEEFIRNNKEKEDKK